MVSESRPVHSPFITPHLIVILLFTAAYVLAAVTGALVTGNMEFVFYIIILLVMGGVIAWIHHRVRLSYGALWCLSIWGGLHMAGGLVPVPESWPFHGDHPVLYSLWLLPSLLRYDHVIHAFGFGTTTWICWQGMRAAVRPGHFLKPTFGVLTLCVAAGKGFGALNEIIEFVATLLIPNTNVGGYLNTGWDLVSNFTGALVAASLIRIFHARHIV